MKARGNYIQYFSWNELYINILAIESLRFLEKYLKII